ncbi:hypothetical protein MsAg5_00650 [Methanosarcinaceae archaeon Ag5]|uniref:Glycerophosphoryl diester phosphodiesterase membrane domain-containing protein n=1 Tax=Methanolapillus africanus TaxID=3028297 RepID=A0AAE4MII8_9EURY|nr:hypothetical protein [Methanosarcinaceae archaeon Ag5]
MEFDFKIIEESLKKAWQAFVDNIIAYIVAAIIFIIVASVASQFITGVALIWAVLSLSLSFAASAIYGLVLAIIGIVGLIILPPVAYGLYYMSLKGLRGEKVDIKDIMYGLNAKTIVRSWIYFIVLYAIMFVFAIISAILGFIPFLGGLIALILMIIVYTFLFFSLYIYVMTPNENVVYALKEGVEIAKKNFLMTFVAMILSGILCILIVTIPLGLAFGGEILKKIVPTLKDDS